MIRFSDDTIIDMINMPIREGIVLMLKVEHVVLT